MSVRERFDAELNELQVKLEKLCGYAQKALEQSFEALEKKDKSLALDVIEGDDKPDLLYEDIIDDSILLITKQQPVASDLRQIITTIKVATDLERVADFAVNISKSVIRLEKKPDVTMKQILDNLRNMYYIADKMLNDGLLAFINVDIQLAKAVADLDDEVDRLYGKTIQELFRVNQQYPESINDITQLLLICRYLERTADHITNVAENVLYLVKGKHYDLNQ